MTTYLVVGSGGREHALAWKLAQEPDARVFVAPGSDAIALEPGCECIEIAPDDHGALLDFAATRGVDLTVVGPEAPLCAGLADAFRAQGLAIFGPGADGAMLEGSKSFAKEVLAAAQVATAAYSVFSDLEAALAHVRAAAHPLVIKADGLAGGKGVVISETLQTSEVTLREFLGEQKFGESSATVVVEEHLSGPELSFMVVTDGRVAVALSTSRDHKRVGEGDVGPNTGGMGAVTPSPDDDADLRERIMSDVVEPTLAELRARGIDYRGFLYVGLMLTADGPSVLEFNVRLGDPETQALLFAMEAPLGPVIRAAASGDLSDTFQLQTSRAACCVVLASEGYPARPTTGDEISGLSAPQLTDTKVFHAGTIRDGDGVWRTRGGRVLGVTARAATVAQARANAYRAAEMISWRGMHARGDIGA